MSIIVKCSCEVGLADHQRTISQAASLPIKITAHAGRRILSALYRRYNGGLSADAGNGAITAVGFTSIK